MKTNRSVDLLTSVPPTFHRRLLPSSPRSRRPGRYTSTELHTQMLSVHIRSSPLGTKNSSQSNVEHIAAILIIAVKWHQNFLYLFKDKDGNWFYIYGFSIPLFLVVPRSLLSPHQSVLITIRFDLTLRGAAAGVRSACLVRDGLGWLYWWNSRSPRVVLHDSALLWSFSDYPITLNLPALFPPPI